MDSVTQFALGAAIGESTLGKKVGKRAPIWGGICGTIPDLDVFFPYPGPVEAFTYHRGATHSLIILALLTPLVVALILKLHPDTREHIKKWFLLVFLALTTHPLLDSLTVYGTQLFWPVTELPVSFPIIYIADPTYTIPLLIGVLGAICLARDSRWRHGINTIGFTISSCYLLWCLAAKFYVDEVFTEKLAGANLSHVEFFTEPAPFNSLLWVMRAVDEQNYYTAYHSFLDDEDAEFIVDVKPRQTELLSGLEDDWSVQRLIWHSGGYYKAYLQQQDVIYADLRMGMEPIYAFTFKVGSWQDNQAVPVEVSQVAIAEDPEKILRWVWNRIWSGPAPLPE